MSDEPMFDDVLDQQVDVGPLEAANLVCRVDHARTSAAYWRGRCAGLEVTLAYLKDRLNRLEARDRGTSTPPTEAIS